MTASSTLTPSEELRAIHFALEAKIKTGFDIKRYCFKEQLAFLEDKSRFKTAVCSRRSGKTIACAAHLMSEATKHDKRVLLYITLSRANAKRIIWGELLELNRVYNMDAKINETDLSLMFPNGSIIYCSGASDKTEIEKFRGLPISLCYVDESQSFSPYIEDLVDQVIAKALFDYNGTLCLIGTPGPVPSGYFYNCAHSPNWSHHAWTMFQNPHLEKKSGKPVQVLLEEEMSRKGVSIQDPTIQRECFGRWVTDTDALVFKYNPVKNNYESLPPHLGPWQYVIGVDLGYDDSDAIAVIGWHNKSQAAYLIEEHTRAKQGITELATQLNTLINKYDPMACVMDTGGLGKKISEEIQRRYSLPIKAAEKTRKFEFIEILNDAMRTGRFFARNTGRFAQDCALVEWDRESIQPKISDNFHSDICLPAGSMITTDNGPRAVESLTVGTMILTRKGYKPLECIAKTSDSAELVEIELSSGHRLRCTPAHKIWTNEDGFIRADALTYAHSFIIENSCSRKSNFVGKTSIFKRIENIIMGGTVKRKFIYIGLFGKLLMGQSQIKIKYITPTVIRLITALKTLFVSLQKNTGAFTQRHFGRLATRPKNGTDQKKELNGTKTTQLDGEKKIEQKMWGGAPCAVDNMSMMLQQKTPCIIVQTNAEQGQEEILEKITLKESVHNVVRHSFQTNTKKDAIVVTLVQRRPIIKKEPVYNFTVKDVHEYYANGILNRNCDAVLYAFREALHWLWEPEKKMAKIGQPEWLEQEEQRLIEATEVRVREEKEENVWGDLSVDY